MAKSKNKQAKTHSAQRFTDYQLMVVAHEANKTKGAGGNAATMWVGTIAMETNIAVANEVDCTSDLEMLIKYGGLITFGGTPTLRGIKFHWLETSHEDPNTGEIRHFTKTQVTITYMSDLRNETIDEQQRRYKRLTGEVLEFSSG